MTYDLVIGDRAYSSWSLRGWLLFDAFGIPVKTHSARLYTDELATTLRDYFPARPPPPCARPKAAVVPETIAIAEELATRHPEAGIWPADPHARATARVLAAEMHAGFTALRSHCPMNLRVSYTDCVPPRRGAEADLPPGNPLVLGARHREIADPLALRRLFGGRCLLRPRRQPASPPTTCPSGPTRWPMSTPTWRIPRFRRWRAMGLVDGADQDFYRRDYPRRDWPGPVPPARPRRRGNGGETQPAPIPASPSPMRWSCTAAASASATPSAATRPWPTRSLAEVHGLYQNRKPFRPTR
jgi:glutathione S-transferase